jgi:hypothetical protein
MEFSMGIFHGSGRRGVFQGLNLGEGCISGFMFQAI